MSPKFHNLNRSIEAALCARSLVLLVGEDEDSRDTFLRELLHVYQDHEDYSSLEVSAPGGGTDALLMRLIATRVGLPPLRTRYALWRQFETYCARQYEVDKRVLLFIGEAQLLTDRQLDLLHALSTICVGDDLAVQMVMVSDERLLARLQKEERHRALYSRLGVRARIGKINTRQAA